MLQNKYNVILYNCNSSPNYRSRNVSMGYDQIKKKKALLLMLAYCHITYKLNTVCEQQIMPIKTHHTVSALSHTHTDTMGVKLEGYTLFLGLNSSYRCEWMF